VRRTAWLFAASLAAALPTLAWLYAQDAPLRTGVAFHHLASVRELARGELPPRHNLVDAYLPQGHYGPYLVLLGTLARWTGAGPLALLQAAGLALLVAFAILVWRAAVRFASPEAGGFSLLAALLLWGPWPGRVMEWSAWGWPGTTSLADAQNFFYPQQAGLVLTLLLLLVVSPPCAQGERPTLGPGRLVAALLVSALLIATHPLSGLALVPALAALGLAEPRAAGSRGARLALLLGLAPAGLALAALWPYYPVLALLEAFVHPAFREPLPLGAEVAAALPGAALANPIAPPLSVLGPALFGLPGCVVLARRGRPFLLAWALADLALASIPALPLRQRLLVCAALPLQLGASAAFAWAWSRGWLPRALVVALLALGGVSAAARIRWVLAREPPELGFVARLTPDDAVVLSDPRSSNAVAGLTGRKVVAPEGPDLLFLLAGGGQRIADVERFLRHGTTPAERAAILARWRVSHVLVDRLGHGGPRLPDRVVYEGGGYVLYDVRQRPLSAP
jgi:hypothetical protein